MSLGISHSNRGKGLENYVEWANAQYRAKGIAVVQKVAVPTKALPDRRTGDLRVIREKSTVDYVGTWQGRAVAFDAKETRQPRFPFDSIHPHQVQFLADWQAAGGVSFLLVEVAAGSAGAGVLLIPWVDLQRYWMRFQAGGRASISADELSAMPVVRPGRGVALDYLAALERENDSFIAEQLVDILARHKVDPQAVWPEIAEVVKMQADRIRDLQATLSSTAQPDQLAALWAVLEAATVLARDVETLVAECCGEKAGHAVCEAYGCSTLTRLISPLRAALSSAAEPVSCVTAATVEGDPTVTRKQVPQTLTAQPAPCPECGGDRAVTHDLGLNWQLCPLCSAQTAPVQGVAVPRDVLERMADRLTMQAHGTYAEIVNYPGGKEAVEEIRQYKADCLALLQALRQGGE